MTEETELEGMRHDFTESEDVVMVKDEEIEIDGETYHHIFIETAYSRSFWANLLTLEAKPDTLIRSAGFFDESGDLIFEKGWTTTEPDWSLSLNDHIEDSITYFKADLGQGS